MRARGRQPARPRRSSAHPQEPHSDERRPQCQSPARTPPTSTAGGADPDFTLYDFVPIVWEIAKCDFRLILMS
eukprot:1395603-Prymnesium_polylepis.1